MQRPIFPAALAAAIERIGEERGLRVGYDTHYDAGNYEISWWRRGVLYRLDFQPRSATCIQVALYGEHFPTLPRLLRWAWRNIPMFPYLARVEAEDLGWLSAGEATTWYSERVKYFLNTAA
ncbi:MAG TPA: hypothetical protein VLK82_13340 [Candidatus Tectomicrobia bacterium]|nr:hypothetical protein [Candidatus Tectomicrobia bacterium]